MNYEREKCGEKRNRKEVGNSTLILIGSKYRRKRDFRGWGPW